MARALLKPRWVLGLCAMVVAITVLSAVAAEQATEKGISMEKRLSLFQRVVYIFFGFTGLVSIIATTNYLRTNPPIKVFFHLSIMVASMNWGVLGITGKDIVEWIELALKAI
jgi:uncharacterized membrane protein YuzA (DUF378 family)